MQTYSRIYDRILGAYYKIHDALRIPSVIAGMGLVMYVLASTHGKAITEGQWGLGLLGLILCYWGFSPLDL